ncbi:MAG TPA: 50S ribosomal protein L18e [Candidatus Bilamarchaeaceae archaeon]|nr:50S ribosomal protein L18e [Candidatus Bilamarchaeaceae archaeon]
MALKDKSNKILVELVNKLQMDKKPLWRRIAKELSRSRSSKVQVNLQKLDKYGNEKTTILVPGKVLGSGQITKKLTVAAFSFSESAKKLISAAGGKFVSLDELYSSNPEGKDITIIK